MSLQFAATAFATAFTIIDPIGIIPFVLTTTAGSTAEKRRKVVDLAAAVAAGIVLFMAILGQAFLGSLGITLPAFTIAGGVLLFLIAIDMLFARPTRTRLTDEEEQEAVSTENPAVFPLAIPMLAGPGTIATVILLVDEAHGNRMNLAIVFVAYALALLAAWVCMRASTLLLRVIGTTGIHVITRLLGIVLAALAVQFVLNGLLETPLFHHT